MDSTLPTTGRTYSTKEAALILGVSTGLLYKIGRAGRRRPEFDRYGCIKIGDACRWSAVKIDAAAHARSAA